MNSDDKFENLNEIDSWEKELKKLKNSDEDEAEQISEIEERISDLYEALANCERGASRMKEYIVVITYNFDTDFIAIKCKTYEEAVEKLNELLNEEIEIVKRENEYTPSVLRFADDDVTLVYESGYTLDLKNVSTREYLLQDCAFYKIIEV